MLIRVLALQAIGLGWIAFVTTPSAPYISFVIPFILAGVGMGLFFTPMANLVLSSVRREQSRRSGSALLSSASEPSLRSPSRACAARARSRARRSRRSLTQPERVRTGSRVPCAHRPRPLLLL
jgi:hypothetical protein